MNKWVWTFLGVAGTWAYLIAMWFLAQIPMSWWTVPLVLTLLVVLIIPALIAVTRWDKAPRANDKQEKTG